MNPAGYALAGSPAPVCFARPRPVPRAAAVDASGLAPEVAQALSNTLPFLRCGEESAVHAFGRRLARAAHGTEQAVLDVITADEARHAAWLEALAEALPPPDCGPDAGPDARPDAIAMARFFRRLLTRDPALHFARVAALDLVVCAILRPLVARGSALSAAAPVADGLRSIRRDEARHVRVARQCARRLGVSATRQHELDAALRDELAALLAPVRSNLQRLGLRGFDPPGARVDA